MFAILFVLYLVSWVGLNKTLHLCKECVSGLHPSLNRECVAKILMYPFFRMGQLRVHMALPVELLMQMIRCLNEIEKLVPN